MGLVKVMLFAVLSWVTLAQAGEINEKKNAVAAFDLSKVVDQNSFSCMDQKNARDLAEKFHVDVRSIGGISKTCKKEVPKDRLLLNALNVLESEKFDDAVMSSSKGFLTPHYTDYLLSHIKLILQDKFCGGNAVACVQYGTDIMHLTDSYFDRDNRLIVQVSTLIHETRHTENYRHFLCFSGFYANQDGACDADYSTGGSYAVEVEYYSRVALHGLNFHPTLKTESRIEAAFLIDQNFVIPPGSGKSLLVLVSQNDGHLVSFDGANVVEHATARVGSERIFYNFGDHSITLLSGEHKDKKPLRRFNLVDWNLGNSPISFADIPTPNDYVRDVKQQKSFYLWDKKMRVKDWSGNKPKIMENKLDPSKGKPLQFVTVNPCTGAKDQMLIRYDSNTIDQITSDPISLAVTTTGCQWPTDVLDIKQAMDQVYVLSTTGEVGVMNGTRVMPVAAFAGQKFRQFVGAHDAPDFPRDAQP